MRQEIATADSIRFAALKQIRVSELQPKPFRFYSVQFPPALSRIVRPIPAIPINLDSIRIATRTVQLRDSLSAIQANPLQPKQAKSTPSPAVGLLPRVIQPPAATPANPVRVAVRDSAQTVPVKKPAVTQPAPLPVRPSVVQAAPLPVEPAKGGIPPATVPAQRVPNTPTPTNPLGSPAYPSSTNPAAGKKVAVSPAKPNLVVPKPGKPGAVTPTIVRPQSSPVNASDSLQLAVIDSVGADSVKTADSFKTTVKYESKDSTIYAADGQTVELFGEASVIYGDISLKADYIRLNYLTNEVYAKGRYDSTAQKWIGRPVFQDGEGKYDAKEIRYNFKSKKAVFRGSLPNREKATFGDRP